MRWCRLLLRSLSLLSLLGAVSADAGERPVVVATVAPLGYLVEQLAGERVELRTALPPGVEIETFAPSPQQIRTLADARLIVGIGHPDFALETAYLRPFADRRGAIVWLDLATVAPATGREEDPHLWVSPRAMRRFVTPLAEALGRLVPAAAGEIGARAATLGEEIDALDRSVRRTREELRNELKTRSDQELDRSWQEINNAVVEYAREQGYDLIVASPVVYANPRVDITDAVLERLRRAAGARTP